MSGSTLPPDLQKMVDAVSTSDVVAIRNRCQFLFEKHLGKNLDDFLKLQKDEDHPYWITVYLTAYATQINRIVAALQPNGGGMAETRHSPSVDEPPK